MSPPFRLRGISFVWPVVCIAPGAAISIAIGHTETGICIGITFGTGGMLVASGRNSGLPGTKL